VSYHPKSQTKEPREIKEGLPLEDLGALIYKKSKTDGEGRFVGRGFSLELEGKKQAEGGRH